MLLLYFKSSIAGIYEDYFILHEEAFIFPYWLIITSPQLVGNTTLYLYQRTSTNLQIFFQFCKFML